MEHGDGADDFLVIISGFDVVEIQFYHGVENTSAMQFNFV